MAEGQVWALRAPGGVGSGGFQAGAEWGLCSTLRVRWDVRTTVKQNRNVLTRGQCKRGLSETRLS